MKWVDKLFSAKLIAWTQFRMGSELRWAIPTDMFAFIEREKGVSVYPGSTLLGLQVYPSSPIGTPRSDSPVASIESPGSCISVQILLDGTMVVREYE